MYQRLGALGILGVVFILAGLGLVTYFAPVVGAGLALVFVGTALVIKSLVGNMLQAWGMT